MKLKGLFMILIIILICISTTVIAQQNMNDEAFLESMRTEIHPDREKPDVPDNVTVKLNLIYGNVDGRNLTADIFTPKETPESARPAIVFLHGGSWVTGNPSQFHYHAGYLASKYGMFAMSVDYRLSGEAQFPAALQDAKCAVRWVRSKAKEYNIDPERIAIAGGSAGGHLSSMMLTTAGVPEYEGKGGNNKFSSHVNLGVLFNGEFDMWDLVDKGSLIGAMEKFIGGKPDEIPGLYSDLSSVHRIHKYVPPVLLLHGTVDKCVSHDQSIAFYNRLNAVGVHAEIALYDGKPHAWFNGEPDRTITLKRMEKFLAEQFKMNKMIYQWSVIGPFDNPVNNNKRKGLQKAYPPENEIDLKKTYTGKNNVKLKWQKADANDDGFIDFNSIFKPDNDNAVAYALTYIWSPKKQDVNMFFGSDDGCRIWMNEKLIHHKLIQRAARPNDDVFDCRLKKGWNKLLVKIEEVDHGWGFYLKISDPDKKLKFSSARK